MTQPSSGSQSLPPTEQRHPRSHALDELDTLSILRLLNEDSMSAVHAVSAVLPQLADIVDRAAEALRRGGTVHYFGAGTSGRLGVLDASELKPTFNLEEGRVVGHIAGGDNALVEAVENVEDSAEDGRKAAAGLGPEDVAIGLAASGSTPYVGGALAAADEAGATTVLISNHPQAPLAASAQTHLVLDTGAEVITGSTRLKAGTAQKLVLNAFSTALMVRLDRTWQNLMVSVVATNEKLRGRTVRILSEAVGIDQRASHELLERTRGDLKAAIVASLADVSPSQATEMLQDCHGSVRQAIKATQGVSEVSNDVPADHHTCGSGRSATTQSMREQPDAPESVHAGPEQCSGYLLGIDIGGSGSRAALIPMAGGTEQIITGPRVEVTETGSTAPERIRQLIGAATHTWSSQMRNLRGIGIGATGVASLVQDPAGLAYELSAEVSAPTALAADAITAHLGALQGGSGAVAVLGTGAIAIGHPGPDSSGRFGAQWHRVDGWGHILGDRGGGSWVGNCALEAALRAHDGLWPEQHEHSANALLEAATQRFGPPETWPTQLYTRQDRAGVLAEFARDVVDLSQHGDPVATDVLTRAGTEAARSTIAAHQRVNTLTAPDSSTDVVLTGALAQAAQPLRDGFCAHITDQSPTITVRQPLGDPIHGALTLAKLAFQRMVDPQPGLLWVADPPDSDHQDVMRPKSSSHQELGLKQQG